MSRSTLLKVVLLGDGGVGKSALMMRFVKNQFEMKSFHTIGVEFLNKDITVGNTNYTLQIWDTAGQERFKSLRTPFYRGADCCLLVFAVNDKQSFMNIQFWKKEFLYYADIFETSHFPFVVVGNKCDLEQDRVISYEDAKSWCDQNSIPYYESSAKISTNVHQAFKSALDMFISRDSGPNDFSKESISLASRHKDSSCFC